MKTINENFTMNALTISVRAALAVMLVMPMASFADDAANAEADALKKPSNVVEIGGMNVDHKSAKFGEYNGLDDGHAYGVGNWDIRGGDAYGDGDGTMRYETHGIDIGTTARSLGATISNQGTWNLGVGYDELRHNITDSYQTPFQGNMGGSTFTLPGNFGIINTSLPASTTATGGTRGLTLNQKSFFHEEDVYTERKNKSFTAGWNFAPQWNVQVDYNRLDQTGAKLISSATEARPNGGLLVIPPGTAGTGSTSSTTNNRYYVGQAVDLLMNPTQYQTDTVNLALNWTGEKARVSASYFGSFFSDKNNGLSWSNPFTANNGTGRASATGTAAPAGFPMNTLSTAPDNQFNQFNLTGGYDFSQATKLAGGFSYAHNTQDDSFLTNSVPTGGLPKNSLDGKVNIYNANLKLTNQTTKDLTLEGGVKFDERDNTTKIDTYNWYLVDGGGTLDDAQNAPESYKKYQVNLAADYRVNDKNNVRVAYDYDHMHRWCNHMGGTNCTNVTDDHQSTLALEYRLKATDTVRFNAGYSYADRKSSVTNNFDSPIHATTDNDGTNVTGFVAWFWADRREQITKAGVTWQATDKLDLGLNGRYIYDDFNDNSLGVQSSDAVSLNMDATFSYSENGTVSAYGSLMKRWRDMTNAGTATSAVPPVATGVWDNRLTDYEDSVGLNAKHKGLLGGKLELAGDFAYVFGKSGYSSNLQYNPSTPCGGTATNHNLACGSTPDISNRMWQLKLNGDYKVNAHSTVALGYTYQRLLSNDYYYNGYQMGLTSNTLMPTNQQEQSYSVNLLTATYSYNF